MPLIEADQTFALAAVILLIVAFGLLAERRAWGRKLGGPLLLLAVAMAAANLGVIPHRAPLYNHIAGFLVPVAIPLLLMRADFRTIYRESGPMFVAFLVAAAATVAGALVGAWVIDMGPLEAEIAGTVTSSYIGGSLNFVATAEAVGIKDSSIYVAGLSADAVGAVFFLLALMLLPASRLVRAAMPSSFIDRDSGSVPGGEEVSAAPDAAPFQPAEVANGLAVSLVVCALAAALTSYAGVDSLFILAVTALSLVVANVAKPVLRHVSSEFGLGTLFMYIFFVAIGAGANLADVLGAALPILLFIVVMVLVHLCVLVAAGRVLKLDLAEVMIASNACILGPAPAAALAASKGWKPLVAPGILVGLFGYAIATFIGVALSAALKL
ncbi:MAG TPA: DUF819 family protein [Woeseiaceae bacterium]|nr:DUF819 family protein [Woeseiaceae bacterium]